MGQFPPKESNWDACSYFNHWLTRRLVASTVIFTKKQSSYNKGKQTINNLILTRFFKLFPVTGVKYVTNTATGKHLSLDTVEGLTED